MLAPEGALAFEIVQRERIKKGGSLNPLRPPKYVLLVVKATLSEACSDLSESEVRATLEVLLDEVRSEAGRRGEQIDGVSAFLYQSRDHIIGESAALGQAEWWPKGHSFNPENTSNINNKATYVEVIDVFSSLLPKREETVVDRLSVDERRGIFTELVRGEDRAWREAETQYPTAPSGIPNNKLSTYDFRTALEKNEETASKLRVRYERELLEKHGLTQQELSDIKEEAMNERWPLPRY